MPDGNNRRRARLLLVLGIATVLFASCAEASLGDHLADFKSCVKSCKKTNCNTDNGLHIPLFHRLLLWDCKSECDYACQHIVTDKRLARDPPYLSPVLQFHGKWPFYRLLGIQEPASVLFSLLNFLAHYWGITRLQESIPSSYPLLQYYLGFGYCSLGSWIFSMIFHTRDFDVTEKLDYFGAGAVVMYSLFYSTIRIFRLDAPRTTVASAASPNPNNYTNHNGHISNSYNSSSNNKADISGSIIRLWALFCAGLYLMHISYLTFITFDYTYNMAANVAVGFLQNILWTWFSVQRYRKIGRFWAAWPGLIVAWLSLAMSLELFDFPPWWGMVDAHALWHLGTVVPTVWWYNFLVKDAQEDLHSIRLKA